MKGVLCSKRSKLMNITALIILNQEYTKNGSESVRAAEG
jgi:hypothetical protein